MKITPKVVKFFESEQKQFGTKVALTNLLWGFAAVILTDLGVSRIRTSWKKEIKK